MITSDSNFMDTQAADAPAATIETDDTVIWQGQRYYFPDEKREALVVYLTDEDSTDREVSYRYQCQGLHDGPPIILVVKNIRDDSDDECTSVDYDGPFWLGSDVFVGALVWDCYHNHVLDDVKDAFFTY